MPLADEVSVYKNYEVASVYDIVPGYHDCITEYRYVDTDIDGLYDTVYIDYEEAFLIGSINRANYRVFADFDAMRTFTRSALYLDEEDSYTLFESNLSIEEMKEGQLVRVKESYDSGYTFYDITVENTKTIVGEVTNINSSSGCTRYTIGGTDYRMLTEEYSDVAVGDSIEFVACDDVIVKYQFAFDANIGVILDVGIWEEFDIDYQLKLMTQEGNVEVYNLAKKVNGVTTNYPNITIFESSFPVGSILTYYLNENNEICAYDVQGGGTSNTLKNGERIGTVSGEYRRNNAKLGSYFITEDTIFFVTDGAQGDVTENNVVLSDFEILENEQNYNYGILYDMNKNALAVILYEVPIEDTQEVLSDISYGVITEVYYSETFEPICTLQILNQDGKQESHLLSSVVNGERITFDSAVALAEEFPRGELIAYRINDKNEIRRVDTLSGIHMGNVLENTQFVSFDSTYRNNAFGNYKITDATVLTGTSAGKAADVSKENTALVTKMDLIDGENYKGVGVIDSSNELLFSFTYNTTSSIINPDSYPIIITKRAVVPTTDNPEKIKYWGYVNGEEVSFSVADNASEAAKNLDNGDAALYTINRIDEITDALVLAKKTEEGYVVLDNAINGTYETAYLESDANHTFLSTENYSEPTSEAEAKAIAETMMSTQAAECKLAGFATAGKGYAVSVSTVRLVDANNYADTFVNGERNYTEAYDEDRIDDYYVMLNTVAYQINVRRDKVTVTTILDAETDKNTYDYRSADQLDNDDFIYIYNYDGETRLVLIVDVKGDN